MSAFRGLRAAFARLGGLVTRRSDETRLGEEMRFHLGQLAARYEREGLTPGQAHRRAALDFGGVSRHEEAAREELRSRPLEDAVRDVSYGWRVLRKHPGFALTAVLTAALGLTAAVTVFTIVDSVYLRPLPVPHADRLVSVALERHGRRNLRLGDAAAALLRARASVFDAVVTHDSREVLYVSTSAGSSQRFGAFVSANYFRFLGVRPWRGRFFLPSEDEVPDRDAVAVVGYDFWRTQLGADPRAVGSHMKVRGRDVIIVGIAPPGFVGISVGGAPNQVWLPTMMLGIMGEDCRPGCADTDVLARLAPGISRADAQARVQALARPLSLMALGRDTIARVTVEPVRGMAADQRYQYAGFIPLLIGIALFLALIACANLAALLVTRGLARAPEIALRYSLGAGRGRVVRQLLAESLLLGGAGGALGVGLSVVLVRALMGFFLADSEAFPHFFYLSLDARILAFALAATLGAVLLFGLLPAVAASRVPLARQTQGARVVGRARGRMVLVATQVALALTLVTGAVLLARSFATLMRRQSFDSTHVALVRLRPQMIGYDGARAEAYLHRVVARLDAMPDVRDVAFARGIGFIWSAGPNALPVGLGAQDTVLEANARPVSPGFLAAMRIPLLAGREFTVGDDTAAALVAIVTRGVARELWPAGPVLGRTLTMGGKHFRVVGVAPDYSPHSLTEPVRPMVLIPYWQNAFGPEIDARLAVRVRGDPVAALPRLRRAVAAVDPAVPVTELLSLDEQLAAENTSIRLGALVLEYAAGVALFLAALGLYGVIGYLVERRRREIGVRVAIGASPAEVVSLILRQGLRATALGTLAGLLLALAASRLLAAYLVGVAPRDPVAFGAAAATVATVALVATWLPARRAARVDPMTALRAE